MAAGAATLAKAARRELRHVTQNEIDRDISLGHVLCGHAERRRVDVDACHVSCAHESRCDAEDAAATPQVGDERVLNIALFVRGKKHVGGDIRRCRVLLELHTGLLPRLDLTELLDQVTQLHAGHRARPGRDGWKPSDQVVLFLENSVFSYNNVTCEVTPVG